MAEGKPPYGDIHPMRVWSSSFLLFVMCMSVCVCVWGGGGGDCRVCSDSLLLLLCLGGMSHSFLFRDFWAVRNLVAP